MSSCIELMSYHDVVLVLEPLDHDHVTIHVVLVLEPLDHDHDPVPVLDP